MIKVGTFTKRVSKLKEFVKKQSQTILLQRGDELVDMLQRQHEEGKGSDGGLMQSGYSTGYAKRRKKKGLQTRFVDLHFTGKMHKGQKAIKAEGGVDLRSREPYEYYVRANFPTGFKLTKENADIAAEFVANQLAIDIKKYLVG